MEQNADIALSVARHVHVSETGEDIPSGEAKQLLSQGKVNPESIEGLRAVERVKRLTSGFEGRKTKDY